MVTCNGDANGSVTVTGSGGTVAGDYTYLWNNGQTTATATNLAPGTYNVTVKDDNNCSSSAGPVSITEPAVLTTSIGAPKVWLVVMGVQMEVYSDWFWRNTRRLHIFMEQWSWSNSDDCYRI